MKYNSQFRERVIKFAAHNGVMSAARKFGIDERQIYRFRKRAIRDGNQFIGKGEPEPKKATVEPYINRLQNENMKLKMYIIDHFILSLPPEAR